MGHEQRQRHPIPSAHKPSKAVAERIEEQRQRLFRAMNLVGTTAPSCGEDDLDRQDTLDAANEVMDGVALELCAISGI